MGVFPLLLSVALYSQAIKDIESAFLQNNADLLFSLFTARQRLNIALPEPIAFSDHVSAQQAYFLFRKIFSVYTTFEFFVDKESTQLDGRKSRIFKSRWSFKNNRNNNQYVLNIFFYLIAETKDPVARWRIAELKAQKLV